MYGCVEGTAIFSASVFQYVALAVIYSKGLPYRQSVFSNTPFILLIIALTIVRCLNRNFLFKNISQEHFAVGRKGCKLRFRKIKDSLCFFIVIFWPNYTWLATKKVFQLFIMVLCGWHKFCLERGSEKGMLIRSGIKKVFFYMKSVLIREPGLRRTHKTLVNV